MAENERFDNIVDQAILNANKEAKDALLDLDSLRGSIAIRCGEVGYYVGVFMGARLMGASRAVLEKLGEGLFRTLVPEEDEMNLTRRLQGEGCKRRGL